ncbi:MAG TPA: isocitrate/isopropylmalate family dehydrogenase, partial [Myxococcota bacterium]|nr:isocitrate/isopropylmalate family dehydrogenase [Myxococcota bacterium]
ANPTAMILSGAMMLRHLGWREAADLVMLEPNLRVLVEAVQQGRRTFENTLKYVYITTSANFGNMLSMAVAAVFLPFLPLLPKQILLNNFLSDFPAMTIGNDRVDPEMLEQPRRWDVRVIRNSMLVLGAISSFFDLLTFAVLILLQASPEAFRTGWFMESLFTELLILLVVRTRRPLLKSRPSPLMMGVTVAVVVFTFVAIYTPVGRPFGLVPLPLDLLLPLLAISLGYMVASELAKRRVFAALD